MQRWPGGLLVLALAGVLLAGCQRAASTAGEVASSSAATSAAPSTMSSRGTASSAASPGAVCPMRLSAAAGSKSPTPPVPGVADRLVPAAAVRSALLCAYVGPTAKPVKGLGLTSSKVLTSGFEEMTQGLRWLPPEIKGQQRNCRSTSGRQTNYLLAMILVDGSTAWMAGADDPDSCVRVTNGTFTAVANLGPQLTAALRTGRWPGTTPKDGGPCVGSAGRFGQQSRMVPEGAVGLDICRAELMTGATRLTYLKMAAVSAGFGPLVAALNRRPTVPSSNGFATVMSIGGDPIYVYQLDFRYASGPAVLVTVAMGSTLGIDNSSLQAADDRHIFPLIESFLPAWASPAPTSTAPMSSRAMPTG